MVDLLKACVYGLVQGLTEFLPVSSSGHLVIAKHYLNLEYSGITMEVLTHAATALAAIIYMRARIAGILMALLRTLRGGYSGLGDSGRDDMHLLFMIIAASLPAVVAGVAFRQYVEGLFSDVPGTARMLIVTGVFVLLTGLLGRGEKRLTMPRALLVGLAQAFAILPGLSRSGLTVGTGLATGVIRKRAFEFALLLSIPVILGATVFEFAGGRLEGNGVLLGAAFLVAFISGYAAISLLYRSVLGNRFYMFAYYLIPAGVILLLLQ